MASSSFTMRMDSDLKGQMQELMPKLGLDMSTYFIMAARQAVREQGIPFKVSLDVPNAETVQAMEDTRNGVGLSGKFTSVKEMMEDIYADD